MATTTRHFVSVLTETRNTKEPFANLVAKSNRLNTKQRAWVLQIYRKLEDLEGQLHRWSDFTRSGIQGFQALSGQAQRLLYLVDKAYLTIDPNAEGCFMHCDGEPPHACSEGMFRLRVIVVCYTA